MQDGKSHLEVSSGSVARLLALYRDVDVSVSLSDGLVYVLEAGSYLDRVVGDVASSRELRRASAALSRNAAARVDEVGAVSAGLVLTGTGVGEGFASLSSVSLSSSELSSSDDDSSFLAGALTGVAGVWFKKRL